MINLRWWPEVVRFVGLLMAVSAIWCGTTHKFRAADWQAPMNYQGDDLVVAAWVKAASEGQFLPFVPKFNRFLNAPYQASWNDFPINEGIIYSASGLVAKVCGVFPALNLFFLLACLLAATSFYWICRHLRWRWEWCWAGALLFGLSPYIFSREISHLGLSFYWHLPLCLLVTWWAASRRGLLLGDRRFYFALAVALVTGWQNTYYTNWFLQLLTLGAITHVLRWGRWRSVLPAAVVAALAMAAFLSAILGTFLYRAQMGANPGALTRSYAGLEVYALRPLELLMPYCHRLEIFDRWGTTYRANVAMAGNEPCYIGLVGGVGLLCMCGTAVINMMRRNGRVSGLALQCFWLFGFSVVGGLNGVLGVAGLLLFRAQNRVSILLLLLSLCFVVRTMSHLSAKWPRFMSMGLAALICALGLWDQTPGHLTAERFTRLRDEVDSDRLFAKRMEKRLHAGAMVFQLPVLLYPEDDVCKDIHLLYSHFRPYLFSKQLRYSFGTEKGRHFEDWQYAVAGRPPKELIRALEETGFSAICINLKGYPDSDKALLAGLKAAGRTEVFKSRQQDFACVILQPSPHPSPPPEPWPIFGEGWYAKETDTAGNIWRWSMGTATLLCKNTSKEPVECLWSFNLQTITPRYVEMSLDGQMIWSASLTLDSPSGARDLRVMLHPGNNTFTFTSDAPPAPPAGKEARPLAFLIKELHVKPAEE